MSRFLGDDWVAPTIDATNREWFTSGALRYAVCEECGRTQLPLGAHRAGCTSTAVSVREVPGTGVIDSVVVVHHPVDPRLAAHVPYAVALVRVDGTDGLRVIGNVPATAPHDVRIGQRVRVVFEEIVDGDGEIIRLPQWELQR